MGVHGFIKLDSPRQARGSRSITHERQSGTKALDKKRDRYTILSCNEMPKHGNPINCNFQVTARINKNYQ